MAGLEADTEAVRTPSAPGQQQPARGTTTKLRDSCQACAMSKVKCPKEKPACSRCEGRSLACQYVFTRRPGRRRDPNRRQSNAGTSSSTRSGSSIDTENGMPAERDTIQALQPSAGACFLSCSSTTPPASSSSNNNNNSHLEMSPRSLSIPASPRPDHVFATETPDVFSVLGEANMFSALADFGSDANDVDFIMSAMDSPFLGMPGMDGGGGMAEAVVHNDIGSLLIPSHGINIHLPPQDISSSSVFSPVNSTSSRATAKFAPDIQVPAARKPEATRATAEAPPCGCLTQSLELLKTLSARPAAGHEAAAAATPAVLAENKQSIEAAGERLTCPSCAGDDFLLAVLSMTVLKILERYAAAAAGGPGAGRASRLADGILAGSIEDQMAVLGRTYYSSSSSPSSSSSAGGAPRGRGRSRAAAQLVLSELHRVQRLVNQLSPKLRRPREAEGPPWGRQEVARGLGQDSRGPAAAPFSATTLCQMESDVRKSLSALSSEIINGLRQS